METKRVKGDGRGMVKNEPTTIFEDRLSRLPDPLIHIIFSFLPTIYIVRMSILSKRWRWMWVSTPFLYFENYTDIPFHNKVNNPGWIFKFFDDYLTYHKLYMKIPETSVTSFKFQVMSYDLFKHDATRQVSDWLILVVQRKVKELDLCYKDYCLPQFVLNASSLTVLKLSELKLEAPYVSTFPPLKVLSLRSVKFFSKPSLQNLISGCPIIEDLDLALLSIHLDFYVSKTLKKLGLLHVNFTKQWFESLVSNLPLLERFAFGCSNSEFHNISIRSHSLKSLSVFIITFTEVSIIAPSLTFLKFTCVPKPVIYIEAPNLFEANVTLPETYSNKDLYNYFVHFLKNFNGLKQMKLFIFRKQDHIFLESIRNSQSPPLPNLKRLDASISVKGASSSEWRQFLLWCAPSAEILKIKENHTN